MSKSYRIRTQPGVDKSVKVLIDQEFDYLEILSLKILQSDIYTRQCADYGVIVGRVSVNNGFGIPNAKVSVFIPIDSEDQSNPIISELYPYKSLSDVNDEGYRYNLLPYVKSYSAHVPTGTFFTRKDVLTDPTLIQVYDKYYKYNATTNDSGDYMIFGVPVGAQTVVLDVDLSDIGEFSLSPQDLIRMGIATEAQVSGTNFKSSNNLRELPQIVTVNRTIEVEPLWGQPEICNLGITRTDFDLSGEANVEIRPTSIFMGSIISGPNSSAVSAGCRPPNRSGQLCDLTVGPGEILAIRQTIQQDSNGRPILENFSLEGGGKVIDENGTWLIDVPMNLDYFVTNEFGEQVLSNDPEKGIPTKGKYRFKVKWSQSPSLSETTRRAYFLVPNIKEHKSPNIDESYAFSVDWNDYASTSSPNFNQIIQEAIDCEDRFYMMQYNKVYTVSQFISGIRRGNGSERYVGIKNILDETCTGLNYRFPTNDGNFKFDILYIIFYFFSILLTPIFFALLLLLHILYFVVWILRTILIPGLIIYFTILAIQAIIASTGVGIGPVFIPGQLLIAATYAVIVILLILVQVLLMKIKLSGIKVPILTYPECDLCSCTPDSSTSEDIGNEVGANDTNTGNEKVPCESISSITDVTSITLSPGILQLFNLDTFKIPTITPNTPVGYPPAYATIYQQNLTGIIYDYQYASNNIGAPYMGYIDAQSNIDDRWIYTTSIPMADRINLFNVKAKYFNGTSTLSTPNVNNPGGGVNIISVNFNPTLSDFHTDNTIVIMCDKDSLRNLNAGQLISFQDPTKSKDVNLSGGILNVYGNNAITGTTTTGQTTVNVNYANPNGSGNQSKTYIVNITANTTNNLHKFPTDVEYFQVITAMTYNQFSGQCGTQIPDSLNARYFSNTTLMGASGYQYDELCGNPEFNETLTPITNIRDYENICVLILNRGVDPYTPKVPIKYGLGRLFGYTNLNQIMISGDYHMNIPIQGSFKNISHLSDDYPQTTVNGVTAGSNVDIETGYSNQSQNLYFNSFSYTPQTTEIIGQFTGTSLGVSFEYTAVTSSKYSAFTSNLVSYYSHMDNTARAIEWGADCGGINVINKTNITKYVATQTTNGLTVSNFNRFSWMIYQRTLTGTFCPDLPSNWISPLRTYSANTGFNQGYFKDEIVEGGPVMYTNLAIGPQENGADTSPSNTGVLNGDFRYIYNVNGLQSSNGTYWFYITSNYFTRIYDTTGNTLNFSLGLNDNQIVMRGDRLPTSTNVEEYCCNGMVLQKNNNFQIFLIPEEGVLNITSSPSISEGAGSGDLEYTYEDLVGSQGIATVFETFTCGGSVPLDCYGCNKNGPNGTITVSRGSCDECLGKSIFSNGCYKFVTTIFLSLGCDISNMFEWIARNLIMLGACRNVFSHRFVNNWVNGVLYAFPIKTEVRGFTSPTSATPNQPIISYCNDAVILHPQTRNFYYRATPYDISTNEFTVRSNTRATRGENNICYPTTIMDLGPRADYLQELVMSDDYDGYVVNKLDSSSFGTVDDILNLFIVSRFVGNNILDLILKSNILAYFSNSRRNYGVGGGRFMIDADYAQLISINSELGVAPFLSSNYPDAPSEISAGSFVINQQYKIKTIGSPTPTDFTLIGSPNNNVNTIFTATGPGTGDGTALIDPALQNPIFFDCDNVLGIFFSSDTQTRDYITPKRTIISPSATTQSSCSFNNFSGYSQVVPLSQWRISTDPTDYNSNTDSIFGRQFNNWDFTVSGNTVFSHRYQSLDRLLQSSRYFRSTNISQTQYQKGYIYAVDDNGYISANPQYWDENPDDIHLVTVGAPFHFYFGLRRGASAFDRFRTKWINTNNVTN
jgi:hypothetical protein